MLQSFQPEIAPNAHTLILGTMPGVASLQAQHYYAHPRNGFWPIMLSIINNEPVTEGWQALWPYKARVSLLNKAGFGLWDVLANCVRPGSLDSAIVSSSITANAFAELSRCHHQIQLIAFNGKTAEKLYRKHVLNNKSKQPEPAWRAPIRYVTLPSSSPAMASLTIDQKLDRWQQLLADPFQSPTE